MAYIPNVWEDREGDGLNRWQDQNGNIYIMTPAPLSITKQGTPLTSDWMNHIEQALAAAASPMLTAKNLIVPTGAWAVDTLYATYPRRAAVAIEGVTADMIPIIAYSVDAVNLGTLAPVAHAYNGGIYIYASATPGASITILSVVLVK